MTEHSQLGKSTCCDEKRVLRRSHSNIEIADINKVRRRRRRSSDIQREFVLIREERQLALERDALKDTLLQLTAKVQKLKVQLGRQQQRPQRSELEIPVKGSTLECDDWNELMEFLSHFFLVSLTVLILVWFTVCLSRLAAIFILPELHLECGIFPVTTEGALDVNQWRTTLSWQLITGQHPCQPAYLQCDDLTS
ncbi:uncharacterized protein [Asterias amurensis]|uniref:uncharacterized protein n=1 Tax=Asterias amurensis TaxID=7602 RepID=UPI003AB2C86C